VILSTDTQRDIRNAALSALHYIAFDQHCEVSDILALITPEIANLVETPSFTPSQLDPKQAASSVATAPGGVHAEVSPASDTSETGGEEPSILPATHEPDAQTDGTGDFERDTAQSVPAQLTDGNIVADGLSRSASFPVAAGDDLPVGEPGANASKGVTGGESAANPSSEPQPTSTPAVQAQNVEPSFEVLDGPSLSPPGAERAVAPAPIPEPDDAPVGQITVKDRVKALHDEHPEFTAVMAYEHLGITKGSLAGQSSVLKIKWARAVTRGRPPKPPAPESRDDLDARIIALHTAEPDLTRPRLAERLGIDRFKLNAAVARLALDVPHAVRGDAGAFVPEVIPPATPQTPVALPPKELKTLNDRVAALHHQHPAWTGRMIANELGANQGSVSVALARIRNPKAPTPAEKPEFTGRRQMVEHYGEVAKRLGKPS
jgi:hypothetical protein